MFIESDNLSSILGWMSISCWVVVYSPQIYENYSRQSGEGLSIRFVIVWLLGDLCNLVGAVWGGLLPTVILLALYYSTCDIILLCQIFYYRWKRGKQNTSDNDEQTPLLPAEGNRGHENISLKYIFARYFGALVLVFGIGISAWWITTGFQDKEKSPKRSHHGTRWEIHLLGWTSAIFYLGARTPQIIKNARTRCEGLSPALFFFAVFGNSTYAWSICAKSMDSQYLITNAGWLAGSALTVFLDTIVLTQFLYYRTRKQTQPLTHNEL
ncbi:PQ loop repeat-domain-containing protein [Infundibulicybe gibba]|nr:PQ loop repeat-domain-containing protein [Infundibulicybe gibba]